MAKAGDVDASAAKAVKSGSAETAAQRSCAETANPAAEATDCTTAETATTKPAATEPAAAEPASMTTGEPTPSVTATTSSVTTTAPSVATATAATPACKGINRSKGERSTDRGGDGNSDDCFSKHGKFPLWNDLPDKNNLVAATEQRLNVNITIARSGARFAASLCALLIGGVTFDGSTKDAVQCDVRDALVALKAAQAQVEATKEAHVHAKANGGARAYKGRKSSYSHKQYESAQAILGKSASVGEVARSTGPYAPNGLPHQG